MRSMGSKAEPLPGSPILKTSEPQRRKTCKGKELEGRDLHGKVRTTDPLWMACRVKQLLMRVFRAQTHPLPDTSLKKELRQR